MSGAGETVSCRILSSFKLMPHQREVVVGYSNTYLDCGRKTAFTDVLQLVGLSSIYQLLDVSDNCSYSPLPAVTGPHIFTREYKI